LQYSLKHRDEVRNGGIKRGSRNQNKKNDADELNHRPFRRNNFYGFHLPSYLSGLVLSGWLQLHTVFQNITVWLLLFYPIYMDITRKNPRKIRDFLILFSIAYTIHFV